MLNQKKWNSKSSFLSCCAAHGIGTCELLERNLKVHEKQIARTNTAGTADKGHVRSCADDVENLKEIASTTSVLRYPRMQMFFLAAHAMMEQRGY